MNAETDISFGTACGVWWHLFWRFLVFGMLASMASGLVLGIIGLLAGMELTDLTGYALPIGWLAALPAQAWVVYNVLTNKNRIGSYRLVLLEDDTTP